MTRRTRAARRAGYTLIELLVVMGIVAALAALAMRVAPRIMDRDRSVDAVNVLQGSMNRMRAQAARDKYPRGIRLIVDSSKPDPRQATEFQFIEAPPVLVFNPDGPGADPNTRPRVVFSYTTQPPPPPAGPPPPPPVSVPTPSAGEVTNRTCVIQNLTADQIAQVQVGGSIWFPLLGTWHYIVGVAPASTAVTVTLDSYPDLRMGAMTNYLTYHFGVYAPSRPLLGEPAVQLPQGTCVDLNSGVSYPAAATTTLDYEVLFTPDGRLITPRGVGQVFLWVRDPSKVPSMNPAALGGATTTAQYTAALQQGGEQMIVAIGAKSGALRAAPVYWPDGVSNSPYYLARKAVTASAP